jgi:hypothetical protein
MTMRLHALVSRRDFDQLRHRVCAVGYLGRGDAQKIGDHDIACSQHALSFV